MSAKPAKTTTDDFPASFLSLCKGEYTPWINDPLSPPLEAESVEDFRAWLRKDQTLLHTYLLAQGVTVTRSLIEEFMAGLGGRFSGNYYAFLRELKQWNGYQGGVPRIGIVEDGDGHRIGDEADADRYFEMHYRSAKSNIATIRRFDVLRAAMTMSGLSGTDWESGGALIQVDGLLRDMRNAGAAPLLPAFLLPSRQGGEGPAADAMGDGCSTARLAACFSLGHGASGEYFRNNQKFLHSVLLASGRTVTAERIREVDALLGRVFSPTSYYGFRAELKAAGYTEEVPDQRSGNARGAQEVGHGIRREKAAEFARRIGEDGSRGPVPISRFASLHRLVRLYCGSGVPRGKEEAGDPPLEFRPSFLLAAEVCRTASERMRSRRVERMPIMAIVDACIRMGRDLSTGMNEAIRKLHGGLVFDDMRAYAPGRAHGISSGEMELMRDMTGRISGFFPEIEKRIGMLDEKEMADLRKAMDALLAEYREYRSRRSVEAAGFQPVPRNELPLFDRNRQEGAGA